MPRSQPDFVLIGAGVTGLSTALALAEQGRAVVVLERRQVGREASWAGAGMLPPGNSARAATPEARLRGYSHALWPEFSAALREHTGIDNGYHICGAVRVAGAADGAALESLSGGWQSEGLRVEELTESAARERVPGLREGLQTFRWLPEFAQVRNPRHLKALRAACELRDVRIVEHVADCRLDMDGRRVRSVQLPQETLQCERVCVTAGTWSAQVLAGAGVRLAIQPVRGQIVQLQLPVAPFRCVVEQGKRYLVPRPDGLILIGSTEEQVGFDTSNTVQGVSELLRFAQEMVPALSRAAVRQTWAGLRPGSPDELPLLGVVPGFDNLLIGAGHYRSGLQMSPGTGSILADLLQGRRPAISLEGLSADRFRNEQGDTAASPGAAMSPVSGKEPG